MDFNTIIKNKFLEFLTSLGFSVNEDSKNMISFISDKLTIRFCYNPFASEYYYFVKLNNSQNEVEGRFVNGYIKYISEPVFGLITQEEKIELWAAQNLDVFEILKETLLRGDKSFYTGLSKYWKNENHKYNLSIMSKHWGLNYQKTKATTMKRTILTIGTTLLIAITILFVLTFTNRLSLNYNSEGNYFDEKSATVYHAQAVLIYGILSILFLGLTSLLIYLTIKSFKLPQAQASTLVLKNKSE